MLVCLSLSTSWWWWQWSDQVSECTAYNDSLATRGWGMQQQERVGEMRREGPREQEEMSGGGEGKARDAKHKTRVLQCLVQ